MNLRDHRITVDERNYQSCVWLTHTTMKAAAEKVRDLLNALAIDKNIEYVEMDREKPGLPYAPHDRWAVKIGNIWAFGETIEQAECNMLGLILKNGIGFPLYRYIKNS